jgi:hypothetical protein
MAPSSPAINEVVAMAVQEFSGPGRFSGDAEICIRRSIRTYIEDINPNFEFSQNDILEINDRFRRATTHPPDVSDQELQDTTYVDDTIDGNWYDGVEEFPKWNRIKDNWMNGHSSSILPPKAISNIDKHTNHILSHSYNPHGVPYLWKGLVVGNVQSGKTATYTGLIGKALDVGYRVILVMSGRMNSLRYQTQSRISLQIIGSHELESIDLDDEIESLTDLNMQGDFSQYSPPPPPERMANILRADQDLVLVGVVKKHWSPLSKFRGWVEQIIENYPEFKDYPFMLIDDEMDEAGPNTGGEETDFDPDEDDELVQELEFNIAHNDDEMIEFGINSPTTTNQMITKLLKSQYFMKKMYVGFTATPYAVILHRRRDSDSAEFEQYGPDIFPSNYLMVLEDPDAYCGGEVFLGRTEIIVRDMYRENGQLITGEELLRLPAFDGITGVVEIIPSGESCQNCSEQRDANDRLTHGYRSRGRSHCNRHQPGKHQPVHRGEQRCSCECHMMDHPHQLVPPYGDIIPNSEADEEEIETYQYATMVDSLSQAIDDFILAGAARIERGDGHKPCTMMINASHRWPVHKDIRDLVFNHILQLNLTLQRHGISLPFEERLRQRWNTSFLSQILAFNGLEDEEPQDLILEGGGNSTENPERIIAHRFNSPGSRPSRTTNFDDILPFVADFVEEISSPRNHRILNSHTDDIVDYDAEPSLKAIIHGGYNLGRGLTFKGLVVAYMLRGHSDMSGLMQMQRWCGYRSENGGERILDLMKIYLTQEDRDLYHRMLSIEKKNRYLLGSYLRKNRSPGEFAAVLEQDPETPLMSAAKQGSLRNVGGILSGVPRTQRTYKFDITEDDDIDSNLNYLDTWLDEVSEYQFIQHSRQGIVYRDIPTAYVEDLIANWNLVETSGFSRFDIQTWIQRLKDWNTANPNLMQQLTHWTLFIPSRNPLHPMNVNGGHANGFNPVTPIRLGGIGDVYPYPYTLDRGTTDRLKTITSPGYDRIDSELFFNGRARPETHGLLIISPIVHPLNRNYPGGVFGQNNPSPIESDGEMHSAGNWPHLIAIGLWFPTTSKLRTELVEHGGVSNG